MEAPTSSQSDHKMATDILLGLMFREDGSWRFAFSGSSMYPTNPLALHHAINLNEFRMREIDNIVVLGLRGLGTVEQLRANYNNRGLSAEKDGQNVAITQLQMALIIRDHIKTSLRQGAAVNLYVCDHDLTENIKAVLPGLGFNVFRPVELFRLINCNTLVYDVTMHAPWLREIVDFSWKENMVRPAAVITHINSLISNGAVDL